MINLKKLFGSKLITALIAPFLLTTIVSAEEPESYMIFACTQKTDILDENSPLDVLIVKQESDNFSPSGIINGAYHEGEGLVFSFRHYTAVMDKDERMNIHKIREIEKLEPEKSYTIDDGGLTYTSISFDTDKAFDGKEARIMIDFLNHSSVYYKVKNDRGAWTSHYVYRCNQNGHGGPFVIQNQQRKSSVTYDESKWQEANLDHSNASSGSIY